jgi:hypothetical protein
MGEAEAELSASNYQTNPHPHRHSVENADGRTLEKLSIVRTPPHAQGRTHGGRAGFANHCRRAERPRNPWGEDAAEACCDGTRAGACGSGPLQNTFGKIFRRRGEHERGKDERGGQAHARRSGTLGGARDPGTTCAKADGTRCGGSGVATTIRATVQNGVEDGAEA